MGGHIPVAEFFFSWRYEVVLARVREKKISSICLLGKPGEKKRRAESPRDGLTD